MSATAAAWAVLAAVTVLLSLRRPVWGVAFYMLTFFAAPHLWWWGDELPSIRYALWAGNILLASVVLHLSRTREEVGRRFGIVHGAALAMALNATLVHYLFASSPGVSLEGYIELLKFTLLFFLLWWAIQDRADFRMALMSIAMGCLYIGWEVTVNERGSFSGSRLEGVGAPGADTSNGLASLMMLSLPLIGSLFIGGKIRDRVAVLLSAPLALNVLLLCNSRGAFLGLVGAGFVFLMLARGTSRKKAIRTLALAGVTLYLLLGDARILERFTTTFVGSEARDNSAASRFVFWRAGLLMLNDYPLGAGGGAFKYVLGARYLERVGSPEAVRSLHNGFLTEATDWGVQGLLFKLVFLAGAMMAAYRASVTCLRAGRADDALVGVCVNAAATGFLITCVFGSYLANEWAYWIVALLVRYSELYHAAAVPVVAIARSARGPSSWPRAVLSGEARSVASAADPITIRVVCDQSRWYGRRVARLACRRAVRLLPETRLGGRTVNWPGSWVSPAELWSVP